MAKVLRVQLNDTSDFVRVHQFRNLGEEVYSALKEGCDVSLSEIDSATTVFHIRGIHKRELRAIAAKVRKIAEKHLPSQMVSVTELTDEPTG